MTAKVKHLPIYRSGYELMKLITERVKNFSRDMRPTLGRKLQDESVELVLAVYKANAARDKRPHIQKILEQIMTLEMLVQLSFDLRLMPPTDYAKAIEITGDLGKQAGGWKKYADKSTINT